MNVSVVLPTYNEAAWLHETINLLDRALLNAKLDKAEIIIVDDGSIDETKSIVAKLKTKTPIVYVGQNNQGRFLARKSGVEKARYEYVLFIDSRVHIHNDAIKFIKTRIKSNPAKAIWNAHVHVAKKGNIFARFWDAITYIAWRKYFSNPREVAYGLEEFDHYPKGTTCFFVPKKLAKEAMSKFDTKTENLKSSNDDTLLIKYFAKVQLIQIAPQFSCTYHSRSSLKKFLHHAFHRGRVFVDGFLRMDGNRYFLPLVLFLVISAGLPLILIVFNSYIHVILIAGVVIWLAELILALALRVPYKDAISLFLLTPVFAVYYGIGIWSAFINRITNKEPKN